jgi:hypothetical protein
MFSFLKRSRKPSPASRKLRTFRPACESLEARDLMSHTVNIPIPVNAQVLAFAKAHVNHIVGDGQCATLAADAVQSAGGVPFWQLGPTGLNSSYVWGKLVATLTPTNGNVSAIAPGDILQFSNVTEKDRMIVRDAHGRVVEDITTTQMPAHHTAIVSQVGGGVDKYDIQVLQANVQLWQGESLSMQHAVQGGIYWGGSNTYATHYANGSSITVTHTMTSGVIKVYQPYKNVTISLPF